MKIRGKNIISTSDIKKRGKKYYIPGKEKVSGECLKKKSKKYIDKMDASDMAFLKRIYYIICFWHFQVFPFFYTEIIVKLTIIPYSEITKDNDIENDPSAPVVMQKPSPYVRNELELDESFL